MSPWPGLVTLAALALYFGLTYNVGRARMKYNVPPPKMSGSPEFERIVRVHYNTLEQLVFFLPLLWLFSLYVSPVWGAVIGVLWVIGRGVYAWGYYQAAEKRFPGFVLSVLSSMLLLLGCVAKLGLLAFSSVG